MSSQLTVVPNLKDWKAFVFEDDALVMHVPSSFILSVDTDLAQAIMADEISDEQRITLQQIEKEIPATEARKMPEVDIRSIALNVEQGCNLRCTYCYAGDGDYGRSSKLTSERAIKILETLSGEKPHFHIAFFGGEPLLNFELIKELVAWCDAREPTKFTYSITTNAVLLRESIIEFFKMHKFGVTISYDGKGIQEKQRQGKEATGTPASIVAKKVKAYLKELNSLDAFKLRATVAKENAPQFGTSLSETIDEFDAPVAFSVAVEDKFGNAYTPQDIDTIGEGLRKVVNHFLKTEQYDEILRISNLKYFIKGFHNGFVNRNACGAGINYLSVGTDGNYYICHRFTEDQSANVGNYQEGLNLEKLNDLNKHRMGLQEPCNSCWMQNFCGGGCYHENKLAHDDFKKIDPMYCQLQDIEMSLAMKVYHTLLAKRPDLL